MNTVLVWVLITIGNQATYSPPMLDLAACESLQKAVRETVRYGPTTRCVQIRMVVVK